MEKEREIQNLKDENFDHFVLSGSQTVLVKFFADWSGPCHIMLPILDDLAARFSENIEFFACDFDTVPKTIKKFGVQSVPTLLVFRDGEVIDRASGVISKSELDKKLRELVNNIEINR